MKRIYSDASHDEMPDQDHCAFIDDLVRAWRSISLRITLPCQPCENLTNLLEVIRWTGICLSVNVIKPADARSGSLCIYWWSRSDVRRGCGLHKPDENVTIHEHSKDRAKAGNPAIKRDSLRHLKKHCARNNLIINLWCVRKHFLPFV